MFLDLRRYGKPYLLDTTNVILDLSKSGDSHITVYPLNFVVKSFELAFVTKQQMDEFCSIFTGSLNNFPFDREIGTELKK